jgi:hypothetical protein
MVTKKVDLDNTWEPQFDIQLTMAHNLSISKESFSKIAESIIVI